MKQNSPAEIDHGEHEAMIDALMCDLEFCSKFQEQMHQLGVEVPKTANQLQFKDRNPNESSMNGDSINASNSGVLGVGSFLNQT